MRRAVLGVALTLLLAPAAARAAYAPVDRPGPPLDVPAAALAQSLSCTDNLASDPREPVLLVSGTTLTPADNFSWTYEPALAALQRPYCALTLPGHEMSDIQVAGEYVVGALRTMHARTARKVEYVGFSQGGMVGRWALRFWPDTRAMVDDYIGVDPSNHGTLDANVVCSLPCAPSFFQQQRGSHFLAALNSVQETFPGISYSVIYSHTDEVVVPNFGPRALSELSGGGGEIANIAVQHVCPLDVSEHLAMGSYDPVGWALVLDAITHDGVAQAWRVSRSVCLHPFMPGVNPLTFPLHMAGYGAVVAQQLATYPRVAREPALAPYVLG
jgi:hypothetical protein